MAARHSKASREEPSAVAEWFQPARRKRCGDARRHPLYTGGTWMN
jgi:hypothetical protein